MSIGTTIKRLRRERDITQEQLAEYLGITSRAVSQWECDRTAPDIAQIPALCHVFDVSADVLLGIDIEKKNEEIEAYLVRAREATHGGRFEESVEILREGYRRFPKAYRVMEQLADAIICVHSRKGVKDYDEAIALCRRVLSECTDSHLRYATMDTLAIAYSYADKKEEMRALAKEMPHVNHTYEEFMSYRWQGDADFSELQGYLSFLIYSTADMIYLAAGARHDDGNFIYAPEARAELMKTEIALLDLLFPDGDYQIKAQLGEIACSFLVSMYRRSGDMEQVWHWLEKGADFAIHMDTYDENASHTSPILRGYSDGGWIMEADGNRSQSLLDWLTTDKTAAPLREDARFAPLAERLRAVAKKPQI